MAARKKQFWEKFWPALVAVIVGMFAVPELFKRIQTSDNKKVFRRGLVRGRRKK